MAARAWAKGEFAQPVAADNELLADARRFGATPAQLQNIASHAAFLRPGFSGVWPQNVPAVSAFLAASSQWRTAGLPDGPGRFVYLGLDYAGAAIAWSARQIAMTPEMFAGVQVMEAAARAQLNGARS